MAEISASLPDIPWRGYTTRDPNFTKSLVLMKVSPPTFNMKLVTRFLVVDHGELVDFDDGIPPKQIVQLIAGDHQCAELIDEIELFHESRFTAEFYVCAVELRLIGRYLYDLYKSESFRVQRLLDKIVPHTFAGDWYWWLMCWTTSLIRCATNQIVDLIF